MAISVAVGLARHRARLLHVRCQARHGRFDCADSFGGLYTLVYNKYFVDEIYDATVVKPLVDGSRTVLWKGVDAGLIDGIVNGVGTHARGIGSVLRLLQSGNIRSYATWVLFGSVVLIVAIGIAGRRAMNLLLDSFSLLPLAGFLIALLDPARQPQAQSACRRWSSRSRPSCFRSA